MGYQGHRLEFSPPPSPHPLTSPGHRATRAWWGQVAWAGQEAGEHRATDQKMLQLLNHHLDPRWLELEGLREAILATSILTARETEAQRGKTVWSIRSCHPHSHEGCSHYSGWPLSPPTRGKPTLRQVGDTGRGSREKAGGGSHSSRWWPWEDWA